SLADEPRRDETKTTDATYAPPNTAHATVCQAADVHRTGETARYQRSQASRRCAIRRSAMPVTRTSLPGGAVVASVNRCRASRWDCAPRSLAFRSTVGRHEEVNTVGRANKPSSTSPGWIDASRTTVTARRRIQPQVV